MQLRHTAKTFVIGIYLLSVGCASFEPGLRLQELNAPRQPTARAAQEGLEVSVEEFITQDKSLMAFDADLSSSGVLALLIKVENGGVEKYVAKCEDVKAFLDGQPLTPLTAREAAHQAATSEYVGKALGWTIAAGPAAIILWPFTIGASAVHTQGVNKKVIQYFEGTSYQDALVSPKQTAVGFVYYKMPDHVNRLENFVVEAEATGETSGKKLSFRFTVPPVQLSK
jgi:hypothetical protein